MRNFRITLLALLATLAVTNVNAQVYPWEKYGFDPKIVTLSKGKYQEFHDLKTVVEIGSVLYNTETKEIVGFVEEDTLKGNGLKPHIVSRWVSPDPLAEEFSSWSPYNYAMNNPIVFVDPDGRAATKYEDEQGNTLLNTNDGSSAVVTVTDDKRKGFDAAVKGTKNTDDPVWNNTMKNTLLGFELSGKQEGLLNSMNSDWSRKAAIKYWQTGDAGAFLSFAGKEALSTWTNPELVVSGLMVGVSGLSSLSSAKGVMTDAQLLTKAAQKAEAAIGGTGRFAGTAKHTYANNLLNRYQSIYGNRGLQFNQYFNGPAGKGFLDVVNHQTMTIYDYKFGNAFMSNSQFLKYSNSFPGYSIKIIKP